MPRWGHAGCRSHREGGGSRRRAGSGPGPAARRAGRPGLRRRARRPSRHHAPEGQLPPQGARGARPGGAVRGAPARGHHRAGAAGVGGVVRRVAGGRQRVRGRPGRQRRPPVGGLPRRAGRPAGARGRRPGAPGRRVRQAPADADHRHTDRLPVCRRPRCVRRRPHRSGARPGRSLPPRRRAPAPARRRLPPRSRGERMSTTPNVPYRLEFSVEVPGTAEQVWRAIATAKGMSAWFTPTELDEREGGSLHFTMGPEMGSDGQVTAWEPPRRLVYEEDWASLMGKDPDALSPLTSEFLVEAQSGGTCIVRVTSSGFGTGAAWESEFWDTMGPGWMPFFDNLRLYLSHFPGQEATHLEATASHPGDADTLWSTLHDALGLGDEGATVEVRGATGAVERVGERQTLVRLTAPVPGMLSVFAWDEGGGKATAGVRAYLFSADAADYVRHEEPAWQAWLQGLSVPA